MNIRKRIIIFIFIVIITGAYGCMNTANNVLNRKESDAEYSNMMKDYMERKYSKSFEITDLIFPETGFNTALKQNIVTLKDSDGVLCNVKADLGTPYDYYDDYTESYTASLIEAELGKSVFDGVNSRIYVTVKSSDLQKTSTSADNIMSLTFVCGLDHDPSEDDIKNLYNIYKAIESKGYENIYFLAGFMNGSNEFEAAIKNYRVYGKSKWSDYNGEFFGCLTIKSSGLSYDEFEASIVKQ